eukprot:Unigene3198_Nuclearia_a/m.9799 Unigene3198_Nuclearia_a/g.9799  ORF Unigene3198_Nuclearia_a/g.9799 Unigene3198_Nuclearia_a/m.9799 type:complete len:498 (+) Unigene3198_Nuclearia_a:29-1522(+)
MPRLFPLFAADGAYTGPTQLFVNNAYVDARDGKTFEAVNPSTGKLIARVAEAAAEDVDAAIDAAHAAFHGTWKATGGAKRAALMHKLAELLDANADELGRLETLNNGLPYAAGGAWAPRAAAKWLRHFAGYADKLEGRTEALESPQLFGMTLVEPLGVCGAILPFNFPLDLLAWKLAPALACGNTVVMKPSEKTPLSALALGQLVAEAGFPPGVINFVAGFGKPAGSTLASSMKVAKISFTGSVGTGRQIMRDAASSNLKKVTLELGGKSPIIVCEDADIDGAVEKAHHALFYHSGQVCIAGSRVFVHDKVYDEFVRKSAARAQQRLSCVGESIDPATELTPIVDRLQLDRVKSYIAAGIEEGARLVTGGKQVERDGFYVEPTIFADVKDDMKIAREEIFGPVMSVFRYTDLADAIKRANNTVYGLGAGVFTSNINKAILISKALEAGSVWVNGYGVVEPQTPFGGYKQSGIGREGGHYVLHEYCQVKQITFCNLAM